VEQARSEARQRRGGSWSLLDTSLLSGAGRDAVNSLGGQLAAQDVLRVHVAGTARNGSTLTETDQTGDLPSFRVEFECLRNGAALVEVEVAPCPAYQPYRPLVASFVKHCAVSSNNGFDLSTEELSPDGGAAQADLVADGTLLRSLGTVGNLKDSVTLFWRSRELGLGPPDSCELTCDENITASMARTVVESTGKASIMGRQELEFGCLATGVAHCSLEFGWRGRKKGRTLEFSKACGGELDFIVKANHPEIFLQGHHGLDREATIHAWKAARFTLSLNPAHWMGATEDIHLGHPVINSTHPEILLASLGSTVGSKLSAETTVDLEVNMRCVKTGHAPVEVTMPVLAQKTLFLPVKFSFVKTCVRSDTEDWAVPIGVYAVAFFVSLILTVVLRIFVQRKLDDRKMVAFGTESDLNTTNMDLQYGSDVEAHEDELEQSDTHT